ncbi:MAG TPA: sensor domain-containing diguanylate cyclase [Candidatus Limnocylindria bacterium]|nr:sensor domain-containing diguanylate cyclase [Candidatus Limnocylindria bacterium]
MKRAPLTPDEATQRNQVRRFLDLLTAVAVISGLLVASQAVANHELRSWAIVIALGAFAVLLQAWPRRMLAKGSIESVVTVMALASAGLIFATSIISPAGALIAATGLLIPITAAVPYLEVKSLRRLMIIAWVASIATAAASLLPNPVPTGSDAGLSRLWGSVVVSGLVLFLLYQSTERLRAGSREFSRLFSLSSDLAEATDPGVLGDLIARHLTEATDMDDCVIYARAPDTGRLSPFGSHPSERSMETDAEALMERPMLQRVVNERVHMTVDVVNEHADPAERAHLSGLGRTVMLLLPLVAHADPVGVAELTATEYRTINERRLALAQTLAFEAAMAIENGRLYHDLRERSLHDPLTGLANRSLFFDRVGHAVARLGRQPGLQIAVLYIDLDGFKSVNDTLGHARGDRLLQLVAERLRTVVRAADSVGRLGGDEFALLLEDLTTADGAVTVAERALSLLAQPFELANESVKVSASIGIASRADASISADELITEADEAMYEAKRAGKGRVVRSTPVSLRSGPVA